jgi:hypothetical protein
MALHTDLPIHRTGVELLDLATKAQEQMPRGVKRSMGERLFQLCVDMLSLMALANATKRAERAAHLQELLKLVHTAQVVLRVCFDSRYVSPKIWGKATQLLDSIGRQAGGWLKSAAMNKAPAA